MSAAFQHLEVIGARVDAPRWLAILQEQGTVHVADALRGLESEPHIGRPLPTETELRAESIAGAARRALQAVARVLPRAPHRPDSDTEEPLAWRIGYLGDTSEETLLALRDEGLHIAQVVRGALERHETAERELHDLQTLRAAFDALERGGHLSAKGTVFAVPRASLRALRRSLHRAGHAALDASCESRFAVVVADVEVGDVSSGTASPATDAAGLGAMGAAAGARVVPFPKDWHRRPIVELTSPLDREIEAKREADQAARGHLQSSIADVGPRGRVLLDSLEDAAARTEAMSQLASTEHVCAARVYVRSEDEPALRAAIGNAFDDHVLVRKLDEADDTPTLPKHLAAYPFAALSGLLPSQLGRQGLISMLALVAPIAVAARWADMAGGLLLIAVGALLGTRASAGSPRRDTAVLAQISGLAALITGVLWGRMFGAAGDAWFGTGWGLLGTLPPSLDVLAFLRDVAQILGAAALLLALYALVIYVRATTRGQVGRGRQVVGLALSGIAIFGLTMAAAHASVWVWGAAVLAACATAWMQGVRAVVLQLGLDLVGFVRLVAVGTAAVAIANVIFAGWIAPHAAAVVLAPLALGAACLAIVADPAYVAMGVPYDVALGGRRLVHAFAPFARTHAVRSEG